MTTATDLVARLAKEGIDPLLLAEVAQELFNGEAERKALADRRKNERERKAGQRAKKSRDVTGHNGTRRDTLPNDINILTPPAPSSNSDELASPDELKPEHVVEAWNATAEKFGLRAIRKLTPERRRKLATRIKQNTIEDFTEAIASIERSPFLRGENDRGWRADFDWMLEPKNFTKLTERTYER